MTDCFAPTQSKRISWPVWIARLLRRKRMRLADQRILQDIGVRRGVSQAMQDAKLPYWIG